MSGWLTNGYQNLATIYGGEKFALDTSLPGGQLPLSAKVSLQTLAAAVNLLSNNTSKTPVSGTRYYGSIDVQAPNPAAADGGSQQVAPVALITGIQVLVGATGGTDKFIVELHDSTGALVATSDTAGVTVGTANSWQQIPFTSTVSLVPGTYFLAVQLNGTTARFAAYNYPAPVAGPVFLLSGSATGVFGTSAAITAPTTYTAGLAPVALLY